METVFERYFLVLCKLEVVDKKAGLGHHSEHVKAAVVETSEGQKSRKAVDVEGERHEWCAPLFWASGFWAACCV